MVNLIFLSSSSGSMGIEFDYFLVSLINKKKILIESLFLILKASLIMLIKVYWYIFPIRLVHTCLHTIHTIYTQNEFSILTKYQRTIEKCKQRFIEKDTFCRFAIFIKKIALFCSMDMDQPYERKDDV